MSTKSSAAVRILEDVDKDECIMPVYLFDALIMVDVMNFSGYDLKINTALLTECTGVSFLSLHSNW